MTAPSAAFAPNDDEKDLKELEAAANEVEAQVKAEFGSVRLRVLAADRRLNRLRVSAARLVFAHAGDEETAIRHRVGALSTPDFEPEEPTAARARARAQAARMAALEQRHGACSTLRASLRAIETNLKILGARLASEEEAVRALEEPSAFARRALDAVAAHCDIDALEDGLLEALCGR